MISRLLTSFLFLIPYEAAAVVAQEIKPQDVYQAGYCNAFVEGAVSAGTEVIPVEATNTVRLNARDLIRGGDNLSFVPLGEQAARIDLIELLGVKGGIGAERTKNMSLAAKVEDCATLLTEIINSYQERSCGYGRNRNTSTDPLLDQGLDEVNQTAFTGDSLVPILRLE